MALSLESIITSLLTSLPDGDAVRTALLAALHAQDADFRDGRIVPLENGENLFGDVDDYTFEQFWTDYDKKVERKACERLFTKLCRADRMAVRTFIPKYRTAQPDKKFRKDPATFLRQRSWEDEIIDYSGASAIGAPRSLSGDSIADPLPTADVAGWRINGGITPAERDTFELLKSDLFAAATRHTADTAGLRRMLKELSLVAIHDIRRCIAIKLNGSDFNREYAVPYYWDPATFDRLVADRFNGFGWTGRV